MELRNSAAQAQTASEKAPIENMLTQTLRQLFALAEAYPDLKANQNFLDLQGQLSEIEEQIQFVEQSKAAAGESPIRAKLKALGRL